MKKLMSVLLGLSFALGTVTMFAQDAPADKKMEKKKKAPKKKAPKKDETKKEG
ncbi:MAG: hypothetical protein U0Q18_24265 [Bryobacteraceae bacterium]